MFTPLEKLGMAAGMTMLAAGLAVAFALSGQPAAEADDTPAAPVAEAAEEESRITVFEIGRYDHFDRFSVDVVYLERIESESRELWHLCRKAVPQHVTKASGAPASPPTCARVSSDEAAHLLG